MRASGTALSWLLVTVVSGAVACDGKPPVKPPIAPPSATSASHGDVAPPSPNPALWSWPKSEMSSFLAQADHPYNQLLQLMRSGRDRVLLAHAGWRWLEQHGSQRYVSNFAQLQKAREPGRSRAVLRLNFTPENDFSYADDRLAVAVRIIEPPKAAKLVELLRGLSDGAHAASLSSAPTPVRMLLQRDLWQLAAAIEAGVTKVEPSAPLVEALREAIRATALPQAEVAAVSPWVESPYGLPAGVRDKASQGWIEWSTRGHQHHPGSRRSMPFEEPVYGVWRTFVRFPSSAEGGRARKALSAALASASVDGADATRKRLRDEVLIEGRLPKGTELAATVHLIHLADKLEPTATNALLRVLYRQLAGEQLFEEHELSRASVLDGDRALLRKVAAKTPQVHVLMGQRDRSGLMIATNVQTCSVCHHVATHDGEGLGRAPLSWVLGGRVPGPGSAVESMDISLQNTRGALAIVEAHQAPSDSQ